EWVHVQLHQQKGMISLSPPTICNSAICIIDVFFFIDPEQGKKVGAQTAGHGKKCKFSCLFFVLNQLGL
ncbi:hypothetical protein ABEK27_26475, partial [Klebsiella pneumoniae]